MSVCGYVLKTGAQLTIKTLEPTKDNITLENKYKLHCLFGDIFRYYPSQNERPLVMVGNSRQYFEHFIKQHYDKANILKQEISKHSELVRADNLIEHFNISASDYIYRHKKDDYFGHLKGIWQLYRRWYSLSIIRGFKLLGLKNDEIEIIKRYAYPHKIYNKILKAPWELVFLSSETQINLMRLLKVRSTDLELVASNLFISLYRSLNDKGRIKYKKFKENYPNIAFMHNYFEQFGVICDNHYLSFDFIRDIHFQIEQELRKKAKIKQPPLAHSDLLNVNLSDRQREAIQMVALNSVCSILGSAGTGKTTIIKSIVLMLRRFNYFPLLISYTGRACRRLEDVCQIPAKTLHQCVYQSLEETDAVIFDEIGMIPSGLFLKLLYKLPEDCRIIMVGDFNQLPPIKDYSISEVIRPFPRVVLSQCLRSSRELFDNCQAIYTQEHIKFELNEHFKYQKVKDIEDIMKLIKENSEPDFKIITPYTDTARELTQELDNTYTGQYLTDVWKNKWYLGEKVMFSYNNYKEVIMNGDEGTIIKLHPLTINFNNREYVFQTSGYRFVSLYDTDEFYNNRMELNTSMIIKSCVITIHKAQGNEWNEIWFYLPKLTRFITRKLVYTALTRAREKCIIISPHSLDEICKYIS